MNQHDDKPAGAPTMSSLRDALSRQPGESPAPDPIELARRDLKKTLPRRFYKEAGVLAGESGFALALDGRPARTPGRNPLTLPTLAAAQALAAEWERQEELIDPAHMPLTRIVNSAIDGVAREPEATAADIARYGGSDLVCYRAEGPDALVAAQSERWDPVLAFAREKFGARLVCAEGVIYVEQPEAARQALFAAALAFARPEAGGAVALAALHVIATVTGSALLALALAHGALSADEVWAAAYVDEDYQMSVWGADEQALAQRARRRLDMDAAVRLIETARAAPSEP